MALRISALVIILSSSLKLTARGALVLPRPPSSPNDINQNSSSGSSSSSGGSSKVFDAKLYNEKLAQHSLSQNSRSSTNVEKPNTDNYRLLEIELRDGRRRGRGKGGINFGEILREVFHDGELSGRKTAAGSSDKLNEVIENRPLFDSEKLYYLKQSRRKITAGDLNRKRTSWEPRSYLKSLSGDSDNEESKKYVTKSLYRPKKYPGNYPDYRSSTTIAAKEINEAEAEEENAEEEKKAKEKERENGDAAVYTTENSLPTTSELPKQIPPPPSRLPSQTIFVNTTPVLKYMSRRTDILPHGYAF